MSEQPKKNYLPIAVAVFIGVMVGALMSSGDDKAQRALSKRIAALETELAAKAPAAEAEPAAEAAPAEAAEETVAVEGAAAEAVVALSEEEAARLAAVEAKAAELAAASASTQALGDRVTVLGEQMAQIVAAIQSGAVAPAAAPAAPAVEAAPAAAPAESAAEAPADPAAALAAKIGETGLVLSVGQTGAAGDARLFLSRVDGQAMLARVLVVGAGPQDVGMDAVTLANGCAVSLAGVLERRAYIAVDCP